MYIELTSRNQYKSKNASTARTAGGVNIFISYQTIIAAEAPGVTFITSGYYSNTTAHHKTDAARWFNNPEDIEVTPDTLYRYVSGEVTAEEIQQEQQIKTQLLQYLEEDTNNKKAAYNNLKIYDLLNLINSSETSSETIPYKNGNYKNIKNYKTNFKYVSNFHFKITKHFKKVKIAAGANGPNSIGKSKDRTEYRPAVKAVIYSY